MKKFQALYFFCFVCGSCFSQVGQWTWMSGDNFIRSVGNYGTQGTPDTANYPPAVYEPCDFQDQQGNFWVFGGFHNHTGVNGDMADLWKFNPATNEWTWMKGSAIVQDSGIYGAIGVSSPINNPCGRGWGTPSWSDDNGNLWIYGGSNKSADLWKYNIATNEWTWVQGTPWSTIWAPVHPEHGTFQIPASTNTPGRRVETSASWTDAHNNLWLFGGTSYDSVSATSAIYNDMWKFDVTINQWVWMNGPNYPNDLGYYGIKGVSSPLNRPPARNAYAKWKDAAGNFYLFGGLKIWIGSCAYAGYNDVWKYDVSLNNWTWIGGDSTLNSLGTYSGKCVTQETNIPRNAFENRSTCYDSLGNVYMFGSFGGACSLYTANRNELWQYSMIHNQWTLLMPDSPEQWGTKGVSSPANAPPKMFGSVAWYRNNEVWVFGGSDYGNSNSYNCLWRYTIDRSCFPTGLPENDMDIVINISPNPFHDYIELHSSADLTGAEFCLVDLAGRAVHSSLCSQQARLYIPRSNIAAGMYVYQIRRDGQFLSTGKLIAQ